MVSPTTAVKLVLLIVTAVSAQRCRQCADNRDVCAMCAHTDCTLDLAFLLDSSESIELLYHGMEKTFAMGVVDKLARIRLQSQRELKWRLALLQYSSHVDEKSKKRFGVSVSDSEFKDSVRKLDYLREGTKTLYAIGNATEMYVEDYVPCNVKVAVLLTDRDGRQQLDDAPSAVTIAKEKHNIDFITVGINREDIMACQLASHTRYPLCNLQDVDIVNKVLKEVVDLANKMCPVCSSPPPPTDSPTIPTPTTPKPCVCTKGDEGVPGPKGVPGDKGHKGIHGEKGWKGEDGLCGIPGPGGPKGVPGSKGDKGEWGKCGIQGLPGVMGPPGPVGPKAMKGAPGSEGPPGDRGPEGPSGEKGEPGYTGTPGDKGDIGLGHPGEKGNPGLKGSGGPPGPEGYGQPGPPGSQGTPGGPGQKGPPGDGGPKGDPGKPGPLGHKGDPGLGLPGPQGRIGPLGSPGPAGPEGVGSKGDKGAAGPEGPSGTPGLPGQGQPGPKGPHGNPGLNGDPGPEGPKGGIGFKGLPGPAGTPGRGLSGHKGDRGPSGPEGPKGLKGEPGGDGGDGRTGMPGPKGECGLTRVDIITLIREICECAVTCGDTPMELVFIIDASESVRKEGFDKIKLFVSGMVKHLTIGPAATRIGLVVYSQRADLKINLNGLTKQNVLDQIKDLEYIGEGTYTGNAIRTATKEAFSRARPEARKVAIVLTDGQTDPVKDFERLKEAVWDARLQRIDMHAVGVFNASHPEFDNFMQELTLIASDNEDNRGQRVHHIEDFSHLPGLESKLLNKICVKTHTHVHDIHAHIHEHVYEQIQDQPHGEYAAGFIRRHSRRHGKTSSPSSPSSSSSSPSSPSSSTSNEVQSGLTPVLPEVSTPAASRCNQPVKPGPCRQYTVQYCYLKETDACAQFWYGGCGGNDNRFKTIDECRKTCVLSTTAGKDI